MGALNLPKKFINDPSEFPDADDLNNNFEFLNMQQFNLIRNGGFEGIFSGGVPELWTISGTGAASAQDADSKDGVKAVSVTFGSAAASLFQDASEFKFFQGRQIKAWCFVKSSTPGIARIRISDGVGSTDSLSFHTGDGTYQLLIVTHSVAATATRIRIELRVEATGSAIFDVVNVVDFESILGRLPNPADVAAATREFFIPAPQPTSTVGGYAIESIISAGDIHHSWRIPHDFLTLQSAVLVAIPDSTAGPQTVNLDSNHAADGEDATAVSEGPIAITPSYIANQMTEFDISSVLTGIAAGDYVGIHFDRVGSGFGNLQVLGIRFRYNG